MDLIKPEYESKNNEKQIHLTNLENIIINSKVSLEGNCFYRHLTIQLVPQLYKKQLNLFWCGKQEVKNICEIGFNAGHSAMVMLLGRDKTPINFTIFDLEEHAYVKPCFEYIQSSFSHVNFEYVKGDSTITIPEWINTNKDLMYTYDLVHVDGGHSTYCISNDMKNADLLVKINGIIIIDDTNHSWINEYVELFLSTQNYVELSLVPTTEETTHRIIKKIR